MSGNDDDLAVDYIRQSSLATKRTNVSNTKKSHIISTIVPNPQ